MDLYGTIYKLVNGGSIVSTKHNKKAYSNKNNLNNNKLSNEDTANKTFRLLKRTIRNDILYFTDIRNKIQNFSSTVEKKTNLFP